MARCGLVYWLMIDYWIEPATSPSSRLETTHVQKASLPHRELAELNAHGVQYAVAKSVIMMGKYNRILPI